MKYRKRPLVIEAVQFTGDNFKEISDFCPDNYHLYEGMVFIKTLEGQMAVPAGSWVIKGIKGEFYSCMPDIFEETYEPANAH